MQRNKSEKIREKVISRELLEKAIMATEEKIKKLKTSSNLLLRIDLKTLGRTDDKEIER